MVIPAFWAYKFILKKKDWWLYSWTGHALLLTIAYILFYLNSLTLSWLGLISSVLLIVTGLGLVLIRLGYFIENGKMRNSEYIKWQIVLPTHIFMTLIAALILSSIDVTILDLVIAYIFFYLYYLLMSDKLDISWILYDKSKFSKIRRAHYIRNAIVVSYIMIPIIFYILK